MRLSQLYEHLVELSNSLLPGTLLELQMTSYYARAKTSYLNPLQHPHDSIGIQHVEIKGGLKEFVSLLLSREVEAPKRERKSVHEVVIEEG